MGSVVRAQMRGRDKEGEATQERGKLEEQLLEPRAINHGFANGTDGLDRIVGPKWRKLGACRRGASPICRAVAGAAAAGVQRGPAAAPEQQYQRPNEDEIKTPGT